MRRSLVLVPLTLTALALPAAADPPTVAGVPCRGVSAVDVTREGGWQTATISAGPIVAADLPTGVDPLFWDVFGNPAHITLRCTLQIGGTGLYGDPDTTSMTTTATAVLLMPPTVVSFQATDAVWICTTVTATDAHGDATTVYWDEASPGYTTNAASARCAPTSLGSTAG